MFLSPLAAQEAPATSSRPVAFRAASLGHDVLLRDTGPVGIPEKFTLPPGGQELQLLPTTSTPYDRYFGAVREVISSLESKGTTLAAASHLMKVGYSFQYITRDPYRPDSPRFTEALKAGDCKSKALWLYARLADPGALFVIGKSEKNSKTSHAWVYWRHGGRWWILDCTDNPDRIAADPGSSDRYIPYYSYGKDGIYRHPAAQTLQTASITGATPAPAVAAPDRKRLR